MSDASGQVIAETKYKAWGEVRQATGTSPTNYTYTGQYSYTADFGLMYYNARWYDPALGRFAQADTIVPAGVQGLDRYAYVNNSPMNYVDPSGHDAVVAFTSSGWDYYNSVLRNNKLDEAQNAAENAQRITSIGGAMIGSLGALIPGCVAVCGVLGTGAGAVAGYVIGDATPAQRYADELKEIIDLVDNWVQKMEMDNHTDNFDLSIILIDGQDEDGYFYQIWVDNKWVDVSYDVYKTLEETFSEQTPQDKGKSIVTEFDGMNRQKEAKKIQEY